MSQSLHVCKICGKWFATAQAVYGHQRVHSEFKRIKKPRVCIGPLQRGCKAISSSSLKEPSFMTEVERSEMDDAAMSLVMLSEGVSMPEKLIHCVDQSRQEYNEVSATCSDVVAAQGLPSPVRSEPQMKRESNFSYRIKICGKSFERSPGGHQTLHSSPNREQLACEREEFEAGHLLSVLTDSEGKKVLPKPSCFGDSQEELIERGDTNVKEHSVESRQDLKDVVAQALPLPLRSKFQEAPESYSSYRCKLCGKSFGCFQALGGHQTLHRPIKLGRKRKRFKDGNSLSGSSEAEKRIVPQPLSSEVSQELTELRDTNVKEQCVELKQDFEKCSTSSDVLAQALPSPLRILKML